MIPRTRFTAASHALILLLLAAALAAGCSGGGSGGGGAAGGTIPDTNPGGSVVAGNLPTPNGFAMQVMNISSGNGALTVSGFDAGSEVLGLVAYHSANPDTSQYASGRVVTHGGTATALVGDALDPAAGFPKSAVQKPELPASVRPLQDMEFQLERLAKTITSYGVPQPVSKQRLAELGVLDSKGLPAKHSKGATITLNITNAQSGKDMARTCTIQYTGTHCYVAVDNTDSGYFTAANAQSLGQFFDGAIWTQAQSQFGAIGGLRWGGMVYLVVSSWVSGNAYFDPLHEYDVYGSNKIDSIYADPYLQYDGSYISVTDFQGVYAHEFQHLMRWYRKVYQSGYTSYSSQQLIDSSYLDAPINEGCSQYFEILVGRGFTNSPSDFAKYLRIDNLREYLYAPELNPIVSRYGSNYYAAGFMAVIYLVDHYGMDALRRLSQADGLLALEALATASGETKGSFFDKFALSLILATRPGMNAEYLFPTLDLSGATTYYGGKGLYTARYYRDNTGGDYANGIDMSTAGYSYTMDNYRTREWAGQFHRFFAGRGNPLALSFTDYSPDSAGAGSYWIYVLNK